jgi:hypothetical protein
MPTVMIMVLSQFVNSGIAELELKTNLELPKNATLSIVKDQIIHVAIVQVLGLVIKLMLKLKHNGS